MATFEVQRDPFRPARREYPPPARSPPQIPSEGVDRYPPAGRATLNTTSSTSPGSSPPARVVPLAPIPRRESRLGGYGCDPSSGSGVPGYEDKVVVASEDRELMRTPEPTPPEKFLLTHKARTCDWATIFDLQRYKSPSVFGPILIMLTLLTIIILFLAFQHKLVDKLRPVADWMHDTPGGWAIPVGVLIIMSFPPLFGHEIVMILCGVVWGIGLGFAIVAAGNVLGELANFYVYKWWCGARVRKLEENQLRWALLAEVVRNEGVVAPVIMRLSFIPSHFLTAVFSTCGMNFWTFIISAVLSLPKQFAAVYVGVSTTNGQTSTTTRVIKYVVIGLTVLMTIIAMRYVYNRMDRVKAKVIYARRKRRQAKLLAAAGYSPSLAYKKRDANSQDDAEAQLGDTGVQMEIQVLLPHSCRSESITLGPAPSPTATRNGSKTNVLTRPERRTHGSYSGRQDAARIRHNVMALDERSSTAVPGVPDGDLRPGNLGRGRGQRGRRSPPPPPSRPADV